MDQLDLNYKQIKCYIDNKTIDYNALSILQMLYPTYQTVSSTFDIYPEVPFIYIGDLKYINIVNNRPEPHIIVATTGEYDFTNKETLLEIAYLKHNKKIPKYIQDIYKTWSQEQFYNNIKFIILFGTAIDKELSNNVILLNIINNITNPIKVIKSYLEDIESNDVNYLENDLLSFIDRSANLNINTTKNKKTLELRAKFYAMSNKNVKTAINNLIESNIDNLELRNFNFILDLIWLNR